MRRADLYYGSTNYTELPSGHIFCDHCQQMIYCLSQSGVFSVSILDFHQQSKCTPKPFALTCTTLETPQPERRSTQDDRQQDQLNLFIEQTEIKF